LDLGFPEAGLDGFQEAGGQLAGISVDTESQLNSADARGVSLCKDLDRAVLAFPVLRVSEEAQLTVGEEAQGVLIVHHGDEAEGVGSGHTGAH